MTTDTEKPQAPAPSAAPKKRTMADIKAEQRARFKKQDEAATPASAEHEDETPPEGKVWLAYRGHEEVFTCYRSAQPIIFKPRGWSRGHAVALVEEAFALFLIENSLLRTYPTEKGAKARPLHEQEPAYALYDDVKGQGVSKLRRIAQAG